MKNKFEKLCNYCILQVRNNNTLCNVYSTNTIKDTGGSNGLLHLHIVVSQLNNPAPMRGIFLPFKSCEK
jgi:hypothetical protein